MRFAVGIQEERLVEILEQMRVLLARTHKELPLTLTPKGAARELSVSLTVLKGMIRSGEIQTVPVKGRRMVPSSELIRIATPQPEHVTKAQAKAKSRWVPISPKKKT
jgi:hypothetical protein